MKFIKRTIAFVLLAVIIIGVILFAAGWKKYKDATDKLPIEDAVNLIRSDENYTEFEDISPTFINAMVAVEDKRFYKHSGVDIMGIGRALVTNFEQGSISQGGSCITQQLAKNMYFMNDNTITRKIAEVIVAVQIEKKYSKKEILELYFNVIYYGSGYYNIYDAAQGYFGKTPSELTDYEATLLAGIPNAPSVYSLHNNPDFAKERQKTVVGAMVNMKYITQTQADEIIAQQNNS